MSSEFTPFVAASIEIENDSRKPNDNQPKRSLLRRLVAFLNDMVAAIIDALEL